MSAPRPLLAAAAALVAACAAAPDDARSRSLATPRGTPAGDAASAEIGPGGGTLASADGRLLLSVPPGAVAAATVFSIQPVTNFAPGALGTAYRLGPEGEAFDLPVTLVFHAGAGADLGGIAVAWQDPDGYWLHQLGALRDGAASTLSVAAPHFSDWTLVTGPTERDLGGDFSIHSTIDPAVDATGSVTLTYAETGDSGDVFLLSGTVAIPPELAAGGATCTPSPPSSATLALRTNIAELRSALPEFGWGMSGHWSLACGDGVARSLFVAFDTAGIDYIGCARRWEGTPVIGPDRVQGTYTIDCGADGLVTGSWDFLGARCGTACVPAASPCTIGTYGCAGGTATCIDTGAPDPAADGRACTTAGGAPGTCNGGACS